MQKLIALATSTFTLPGIVTITIALLAPIHSLLYSVLFLVFVDNVTGIMAYFYKNKIRFRLWSWRSWTHISSSKLGKTINKALVYMLLIISGFIIDMFLIQTGTMVFTKAFAGAITLREIKSVVENVEIISGGGVLSFIQSFIKNGWKKTVEDAFNKDVKTKEDFIQERDNIQKELIDSGKIINELNIEIDQLKHNALKEEEKEQSKIGN